MGGEPAVSPSEKSCLLIHVGHSEKYFARFDICQALEACKDAGLTKSLGVSNFNRRQLELILNKPGLKHKPVSNQVSKHTRSSVVCQMHR